jgi:type II secretory pathway pseudopilin PulG
VIVRALRRHLADERGMGLVELLIAMTILATAVGAMMSLYVATARSMQRAGQRGTALTLAEKQMEIYRTVPFTQIRLDSTLIPTGTDPYVTAHTSDATIPSSSGQAIGGQNGDTACPSPAVAPCQPVQTVTGPDHRSYRIDTYVEYVGGDAGFTHLTPTSGLTLKRVTVVARDISTNTILARASSTFALTG